MEDKKVMRRIIAIGIICILTLTAVAQQLHTTLDVLQPAQHTFPDSIYELIVVNNTVPQPLTLGHTTQQDGQQIASIDMDLRKATALLLLGVTRTLDQSQYFNSVGYVPETQNHGNDYTAKTILSTDAVKQLCYDYQAEAALVCNQLIIYDVLGNFLTDEDDYFAYLDAYLMSHWTLQLPDGSSQSFTYSDTLYWEHRADSRGEALAGLPNRQTALEDMSLYAGEQVGQLFVPHWETVDRYLYEDEHNLIQQGLQSFVRQRWDEAITHWQHAYQQTATSKKRAEKTTHAYAAANIAIAYEIKDDLVQAQAWAGKAVDAFLQVRSADGTQQAVNMQYYLQELRRR